MDPTNYFGQIDPSTLIGVTDPLKAYQSAQADSLQRALASQQIQRQQQQQSIGDAAFRDALANPSSQTYNALAIARPDLVAGVKEAHASMDADAAQSQLRDLTAVHGYLDAGQPDQAANILQNYITAKKKTGGDTKAYETFLDTVQTNPDLAKVLSGTMLSAVTGADKVASTQAAMGGEARAQAEEPGKLALQPLELQAKTADIAKTKAETERLNNPLPETASAGLGPDGRPIFYNPKGAPPESSGAAITANNGALDGFVAKVIRSESGGNATAMSATSSAGGASQFLKGTWLPLIQQIHPELTQGKTEQQVLDLRNSPQLAAEATAAYAQQNAQQLGSAGLPVNEATLAIAHKLGAGGAQTVLQADPRANLKDILPANVIAANPSLAKQTAGQYATNIAKNFSTAPIDTQPGDPNATGDAYLKTLPPARARMIQSIANGDMAMPPAIGRNAAQSQLLAGQVLQYDPTASAINLPARMATRKDFTSGKSAVQIKALNTLAGHLEEMDQAINGLDNTNVPAFNGVAQAVGGAIGNKQTQQAVSRFNGWVTPVASEVTNVLRGSGGAEADIQSWAKQLKASNSPVALHQTVQDIVRAVQARLGALEDSYGNGMGKTGEPLPFLRASTKQIFDRLAGEGGQNNSATQQTVATNAQGQRVVLDPATNTWKPG